MMICCDRMYSPLVNILSAVRRVTACTIVLPLLLLTILPPCKHGSHFPSVYTGRHHVILEVNHRPVNCGVPRVSVTPGLSLRPGHRSPAGTLCTLSTRLYSVYTAIHCYTLLYTPTPLHRLPLDPPASIQVTLPQLRGTGRPGNVRTEERTQIIIRNIQELFLSVIPSIIRCFHYSFRSICHQPFHHSIK